MITRIMHGHSHYVKNLKFFNILLISMLMFAHNSNALSLVSKQIMAKNLTTLHLDNSSANMAFAFASLVLTLPNKMVVPNVFCVLSMIQFVPCYFMRIFLLVFGHKHLARPLMFSTFAPVNHDSTKHLMSSSLALHRITVILGSLDVCAILTLQPLPSINSRLAPPLAFFLATLPTIGVIAAMIPTPVVY